MYEVNASSGGIEQQLNWSGCWVHFHETCPFKESYDIHENESAIRRHWDVKDRQVVSD